VAVQHRRRHGQLRARSCIPADTLPSNFSNSRSHSHSHARDWRSTSRARSSGSLSTSPVTFAAALLSQPTLHLAACSRFNAGWPVCSLHLKTQLFQNAAASAAAAAAAASAAVPHLLEHLVDFLAIFVVATSWVSTLALDAAHIRAPCSASGSTRAALVALASETAANSFVPRTWV
jgi:hypothetical protein